MASIGIDLGTTNSCVGVWKNNKVTIVPNKQGFQTTKSVVYFTNENNNLKVSIGENENFKSSNIKNKIYDIKRIIGRNFNDDILKKEMKNLSYKLIKKPNSNYQSIKLDEIYLMNKPLELQLEMISSLIISQLKEDVETYLEKEVKNVVITVPAYFNESQRQCTKNACLIAGFKEVNIINEPTAALIYYIKYNKLRGNRNYIIIDLGSGTLDTSIIHFSNNEITVKATCGDCTFGGIDFTWKLVDFVIEQITKNNNDNEFEGKKVKIDDNLKFKLFQKCEQAKIELSFKLETTIEIKEDYDIKISRSDFEDVCKNLFDYCIPILEQVILDSQIKKENINDIILTGGTTLIPKIQEKIQTFFNGKQFLNDNINNNVFETVAKGATYISYLLENHLTNFGISQVENTKESLKIYDVIPLSLGIEIMNEQMCFIVERNSKIPINVIKRFETLSQKEIIIRVYQGEMINVKDNFYIGEIIIHNIECDEIDVTFNIDNNSILTVYAQEVGKDNFITCKQFENYLKDNDIELYNNVINRIKGIKFNSKYHKHSLEDASLRNKPFICDVCNNKYSPKEKRYRCYECDFDVCIKCKETE